VVLSLFGGQSVCDRDGGLIADHAALWMAGAGFADGDCRRGCVLDGVGIFFGFYPAGEQQRGWTRLRH